MQRVLSRQCAEATVEPGPALLAADGVEAVGEAVILRVHGQNQWAATSGRSHSTVSGVDYGARPLKTEAVQGCLQWEHYHVSHQRPHPRRCQLWEVGVEWVRRVCLLLRALVQPQCHPLDGG